jgi:hypothetical protein
MVPRCPHAPVSIPQATELARIKSTRAVSRSRPVGCRGQAAKLLVGALQIPHRATCRPHSTFSRSACLFVGLFCRVGESSRRAPHRVSGQTKLRSFKTHHSLTSRNLELRKAHEKRFTATRLTVPLLGPARRTKRQSHRAAVGQISRPPVLLG